MKRIRVRSDFADTITRAGLTMMSFAENAGVNRATLYALITPAQHPIGGLAGCASQPGNW